MYFIFISLRSFHTVADLVIEGHPVLYSRPKNINVQAVFIYANTVQISLFRNNLVSDSGVIYKLFCRDCDQVYLGQSERD